jgi:hypothetical protein
MIEESGRWLFTGLAASIVIKSELLMHSPVRGRIPLLDISPRSQAGGLAYTKFVIITNHWGIVGWGYSKTGGPTILSRRWVVRAQGGLAASRYSAVL